MFTNEVTSRASSFSARKRSEMAERRAAASSRVADFVKPRFYHSGTPKWRRRVVFPMGGVEDTGVEAALPKVASGPLEGVAIFGILAVHVHHENGNGSSRSPMATSWK